MNSTSNTKGSGKNKPESNGTQVKVRSKNDGGTVTAITLNEDKKVEVTVTGDKIEKDPTALQLKADEPIVAAQIVKKESNPTTAAQTVTAIQPAPVKTEYINNTPVGQILEAVWTRDDRDFSNRLAPINKIKLLIANTSVNAYGNVYIAGLRYNEFVKLLMCGEFDVINQTMYYQLFDTKNDVNSIEYKAWKLALMNQILTLPQYKHKVNDDKAKELIKSNPIFGVPINRRYCTDTLIFDNIKTSELLSSFYDTIIKHFKTDQVTHPDDKNLILLKFNSNNIVMDEIITVNNKPMIYSPPVFDISYANIAEVESEIFKYNSVETREYTTLTADKWLNKHRSLAYTFLIKTKVPQTRFSSFGLTPTCGDFIRYIQYYDYKHDLLLTDKQLDTQLIYIPNKTLAHVIVALSNAYPNIPIKHLQSTVVLDELNLITPHKVLLLVGVFVFIVVLIVITVFLLVYSRSNHVYPNYTIY